MAFTTSATTDSVSAESPASKDDEMQAGNPHFQGFFNLCKRHPTITALMVWGIDLLINNLMVFGASFWLAGFQPDFIALCVVAVITAVVVGMLKWWRIIGFNQPIEWKHLRILILPLIAMVTFPFADGLHLLDVGTSLYFMFAYALVAFHEEAIHRGIILRLLKPTGVGRAVLLGSLLFGAAHLTNVFVRSNPAIVVAQAFGAFTQGIGFSMIRFHTNTLWGLVGLHFLEDLLLHYGNLPVPLVNAMQDTVCLGVGIYVYWRYRQRQAKAQATVPV
jgi:hypothetical protein